MQQVLIVFFRSEAFSIYLSTYLSIYLFFYLSIYLSFYLFLLQKLRGHFNNAFKEYPGVPFNQPKEKRQFRQTNLTNCRQKLQTYCYWNKQGKSIVHTLHIQYILMCIRTYVLMQEHFYKQPPYFIP